MSERRATDAIPTLIDFADPRDASAPRTRLRLDAPRELLVARTAHEVPTVLGAVEERARRGLLAVGAVRYEAASAFDATQTTHAPDGPLALFAIHDPPDPAGSAEPFGPPIDPALAPTLRFESALDRARFEHAMEEIRAAFASGRTAEINLTTQFRADFPPSSASAPIDPRAVRAFFEALSRAQPGGYAALAPLGEETMLSVSPELFFDFWSGAEGETGAILTRPMKGTAKRGASDEEDRANAAALRASAKERRENELALEQMRGELGAIALAGSVVAARVAHVEALATVWQMTSDLEARTPAGTRLEDVFRALFPSASVTGAPRATTMALIRSVEPEPRGFYCGAFGLVRPDPRGGVRATFNVPIRTVVLRGRQASIGVGSGITPLSSDEGEWREWQHKRVFLERASAPFALLETLRLEQGALRHLDAHLARMARSARHFRFPWDERGLRDALEALASAHAEGVLRVRVELDALGRWRLEAHPFTPRRPDDPPVRLALAARALAEAHGEFVAHKTTRRGHYDAFAPEDPRLFDTVLFDEEGELTECTRGNVAMRIGGRWVTPPRSSGLLEGVERASAIASGRLVEAVVRLEDVPRVEGWWFLNSLRGIVPATLEATRAAG